MMFILETSACSSASFLATVLFIKKLVKIVSIIVPAILILLLSIDIGKAVIAGSDDDIKRAQRIALKRIIASIIVFFVPIVVNAGFYLLGDDGTSWISCYNEATDSKVEDLVKTQNEQDTQKEAERQGKIIQAKENKNKKRENNEKQKQAAKEKLKSEKIKETVNSSSNGNGVDTSNSSFKGKAKVSKTYSKFKVIGTINKNDFEKKIKVKTISKASIAQSFTVVNDYYVVAFINYANTSSNVGVFNKSTGKKVNSFSGFSLGHSNGATYNASSNNIYVTHGLLSRKKVHKFSANNIGSRNSIGESSFSVSRDVSGVSYDDATGKLYYASGNAIYEYKNKKFKLVTKRKKFSFGQSQDICVYNGIIYDANINGGNRIDIFKVDGSYLGTYKVNVGYELESIDYYGEGNKMAVLFHHSGSLTHYIYIIDTIMPSA